MEELLNNMDNLLDSVTSEDLENMTSEQRREFLNLMEQLEARVEVIKEMTEGGND